MARSGKKSNKKPKHSEDSDQEDPRYDPDTDSDSEDDDMVAAGGEFLNDANAITRSFTLTFNGCLMGAQPKWALRDEESIKAKIVQAIRAERHGDVSRVLITVAKVIGYHSDAPISLALESDFKNGNTFRGSSYRGGSVGATKRHLITLYPNSSKHFGPGKEKVIESAQISEQDRSLYNFFGDPRSENLSSLEERCEISGKKLVTLKPGHPIRVLAKTNPDLAQSASNAFSLAKKDVTMTAGEYDEWKQPLLEAIKDLPWTDMRSGKFCFKLSRADGSEWNDPSGLPGIELSPDGSVSPSSVQYAQNMKRTSFNVTVDVEVTYFISPDQKMFLE